MTESPYDKVVAFHAKHRDHLEPVAAKPFKNGRQILGKSGVPYLVLDLPFAVPHAAMLDEARSVKHLIVRHRDETQHAGWGSLCVHGISAQMTLKHQAYGVSEAAEAGFHWTEIADLCPVTTSFFRDAFGYSEYHRLRFMLLEPGGFIGPHRDRDKAVDPALRSINIALNNPPDCEFVLAGGGVLPFAPGAAILPDLCRHHSVWNRSNEDRFHIIVNGKRDWAGHWDATIQRSYAQQFAAVCPKPD